ncbi:MAG: major Facilitator superfamily [halophilic archaeon J07HX64]|jgi:Major Facilitator Superfamily.|nr:MAG: major Facilitator superfamily [halophilic archaeon J07HX64]
MNRNDRAITAFTMAGHGMVHTYELAIPILMTIWLVEFSITAATLGTVVAVGYGLFGLGALPGGILVDRFGSRRLIIACLFGMGISFVLLSVLPGVVGIGIALALWGIAASVYHPAGLTLISNGVEQRGSAFAYHGMAVDILPALKREDSSVGGSATDPRRQLAGLCALLWDFREGVVSPTTRGRPTRIARAVPSA